MLRTLLLVIAVGVFSVGCGSGGDGASPSSASVVDLSTLPVTLEGMLMADIAEGDVDEDDEGGEYSEFNFGTLTVGSQEILVQVSGELLRSAGLPEAEGRVRATLGSKTDEYGVTTYTITALEKL